MTDDVHPYIGAVSRLIQGHIEAEKRKAAIEALFCAAQALFCAAQATELFARPSAPKWHRRARRIYKERPALLEALAANLPRKPREKFWHPLRPDPVECLTLAFVLYSKAASDTR